MAGRPSSGGGDLDENVGPVHLLPELAALGDGALGVPGQVRVHLQADEAVPAIKPLIEGPEGIRGHLDVGHGNPLVDLGDAFLFPGHGADVIVVILAPGDGLFKDGGVGGDALQAILVDEALKFAGSDHPAPDVIQPDALSELLETT